MRGHSWPLLGRKEAALREFLERVCVLYTQQEQLDKDSLEEMGFEEPQEDEEELERVVETFYGLP